ncbi:MAG: 2-hydroxyacyl-CoA dehydratase family protein [Acidimicrobiia bacterium]|nr:2-hydroxyacyl-CoA dehydratase family protein [Acidimicrobiia bacterium]
MADEELMDIFEECRALAEDHDFPAARRWQEENPGGKVIGHFQVYFPEEIIHAAGALPIKVSGASSGLQIRAADARIAAFVCSILRSSLEMKMAGHLDFLSMFVTHPICDAARHCGGVWARNFDDINSQILYYPHNPTSAHAHEYLTTEYRRMAHAIEEITGNEITDEALAASIEVFNENRRLLRELYDIKRQSPWLVSTVEAYSLTRTAGLMPREEHNEILRRALPMIEARDAKPQDRVRVVFEGGFCEQPAFDMLAVIQDALYIVDDDLMIGLRWITEDVVAGDDPLAALAKAYIESSSYSPVQRDERKPKEMMFLERLRGANAEAAIVGAAKMCEPGLEEQVGYSRALDEQGIPHLIMEFEEKMTGFEQVRMEVETFAESLLFEFV